MNSFAFEEFLKNLKIDPEKIYTQEEAAALLGRKPRTLRNWVENGLKDPRGNRNDVITLDCFRKGGSSAILGKHLINFITRTQKRK